MANSFRYRDVSNVVLPNPMSIDKSVVRTSLLPSLLNTYIYNKSRGVNDVNLYEISKVYDINYNEETLIGILMKGNYISNSWSNVSIKTDFYLIKGIVENILDYFGLKNRYCFQSEITTKKSSLSTTLFRCPLDLVEISGIEPLTS